MTKLKRACGKYIMDNAEFDVQRALGTTQRFCVLVYCRAPYGLYQSFSVRAVDKDHAIQRCKAQMILMEPQHSWVVDTLDFSVDLDEKFYTWCPSIILDD